MPSYIETTLQVAIPVPEGTDPKVILGEVQEKSERMELIAATMGGQWQGSVHLRTSSPPPQKPTSHVEGNGE